MARPTTKTDEFKGEQPSLRDELRVLIDQQGELGQRIMLLAIRAETELEGMKAEMEACAAELGKSQTELAELRVAHEMERTKREIAEARVVKLKAKIAKIRSACDDDIDEEPVLGAPTETNAEPKASANDPLVASLRLTETDLAAVDVLIRRGEAPDRLEMLRTLVRRGLAAKGLLAGDEAPISPDRGEEPATIWC